MPAIYTVTLADDQNALVNWLTNKYNLEHDTKLDVQGFISAQLSAVLAPFAVSYKNTLLQEVVDTFNAADVTTQAQVKALLKVS